MAQRGFPGFPPEALKFFAALARNNRREWFQPRKEQFDAQVKQPMRELVAALNGELRRFAPEYVTDPEHAIYRIYRDTRFSKDKTPYKDHIGASFWRRGDKVGAGFYVQVSKNEVGLGGGIYMPEPATLLSLRAHLAQNHEELRKLLRGAAFRRLFVELQGEALARVPKGYPNDHPAADLLRMKQLYVYVQLPAESATSPEFFTAVVRHFRAMAPLLEFLNRPLARKYPPQNFEF
jgi:uncharacterized protein (TIGR02453 family)